MRKITNNFTVRLFLGFVLTSLTLSAAEPLLGTWKLTKQTINGQQVTTDELTLRVYPSKDALEFAYSVPMNQVHFVSTRFTSVHLDGSSADVTDSQGKHIGSVRITKAAGSKYKAVIEGPNRPKATANMEVSADGKTLTTQSQADVPGKGETTTVQTFLRY